MRIYMLKKAYVNEGPTLKRYLPSAKGSANRHF